MIDRCACIASLVPDAPTQSVACGLPIRDGSLCRYCCDVCARRTR